MGKKVNEKAIQSPTSADEVKGHGETWATLDGMPVNHTGYIHANSHAQQFRETYSL